jgi:hypothetical protein
MKTFSAFLALLFFASPSWGASTINSTEAYSYGANIGWMNWRPSLADGVEIDEYVVSGYIYGANVGWINMGDGTPTNHIQYSNSAADDFGINYQIDPMLPGKAILRGYAYGANIGWINSRIPATRGCAFPMGDSRDTPIRQTAAGSISATAPSR